MLFLDGLCSYACPTGEEVGADPEGGSPVALRERGLCSVFPHGGGLECYFLKKRMGDFLGGAVVKNLPANAGDMGSSLGPGRSHMPRSN